MRRLLLLAVVVLAAIGAAVAWARTRGDDIEPVGRYQVVKIGGDFVPDAVMVDTTNGDSWYFCGLTAERWAWCYMGNAAPQDERLLAKLRTKRIVDDIERSMGRPLDAGLK